MPIQVAPIGLVTSPGSVPSRACSPASPMSDSRILSFSPFQPPTSTRPTIVSGSSAATMTKNWSTSL